MKNILLEKISAKFANSEIHIYLIFLFFVFILIFTIKLQYFSILFSIIFANIGLILFLIFKKKNRSDPECKTDYLDWRDNKNIPVNKTIPRIFSILFLIFFSASLLSLFLGNYTKSVEYYLCISLCAGILIVESLSYRTQIQGYGILLKTVMLSINIVFANHLIFINGISLPDMGLHVQVFLTSILNSGHISNNPIGPYSVFSAHHIFASEVVIVTGYNPLSIYLLLGSFMIALGGLFVFIIGKQFVNFQFGLVTAVLFTCLDYYLMYGGHPEHQAYNFGFALVCFTIILFTYRSQKPVFYILFAISAVILALTHHLSAAIVFVTVCSLLCLDIFQQLRKKDRSIPSKYFAVFFLILLFIIALFMASAQNRTLEQFFSSYFFPYFNDIYHILFGTVINSPTPVSSIPVTPTPVSSIPVTPTLVSSIPVTPTPVSSIPVTPTPVSSPYVPPTGYDKLPLITIFENTLGSSLLVLVSVLGFCSYIKKRSWFGDFTILNGICLSFLLGMGILFSYVLLLPDRIYPFLQIFCLVFLGAAGILWLYHSVSSKNRSIIVGCICLLLIVMSFFSLASIINGFETSLFVEKDVAYQKLYTTSQDVSFTTWRTSFIQNTKRNILPLPINKEGMIDITMVPDNSYLIFDQTLRKTGFVKWGIKFGQHSFGSFDNAQFLQLDTGTSCYDNGQVILMIKNGSA